MKNKLKKYLIISIILFLSSVTYASNLTIINNSYSEYYCYATLTALDGLYNMTAIAWKNGVLIYSAYNYSINTVDGVFVWGYGSSVLSCQNSLSCYVNFTQNNTILYNKTITGTYTNCTTTTTTSSSTTITSPITTTTQITFTTSTYPTNPLAPNNNTKAPINNATAIPNQIGGLGKTSFLKIISLLIILATMLGISAVNPKIAIILSVMAADFIILVVAWFTIPETLLFLINILAVLNFVRDN